MITNYLIEYLIFVNLISALFFIFDKVKAINNKFRISEGFLHLLEGIGGVFSIIILMNLIKHKRSKFKYYILSYLILILWIIFIYKYYY